MNEVTDTSFKIHLTDSIFVMGEYGDSVDVSGISPRLAEFLGVQEGVTRMISRPGYYTFQMEDGYNFFELDFTMVNEELNLPRGPLFQTSENR